MTSYEIQPCTLDCRALQNWPWAPSPNPSSLLFSLLFRQIAHLSGPWIVKTSKPSSGKSLSKLSKEILRSLWFSVTCSKRLLLPHYLKMPAHATSPNFLSHSSFLFSLRDRSLPEVTPLLPLLRCRLLRSGTCLLFTAVSHAHSSLVKWEVMVQDFYKTCFQSRYE